MTKLLLPDKDVMVAVCRGLPAIVDHPIIDWVGELGHWHGLYLQRNLTDSKVFDGHRARLAREIDRWVNLNPVALAGACLHTETFGSVVDRLAYLCALAFHAPSEMLRGGARFDAELLVQDLADGYQILNVQVSQGHRRLPLVCDLASTPDALGVCLAARCAPRRSFVNRSARVRPP
ncbi:DUF4254 domain-containing protein [Nocardia sp. CA-119907]|uniref:DUF4254 domain-containing protein n=1 Tax=Nocardia sp. CA-119907 TaxID=3239973 RepID=UPI003D9624F2